MHTDLDIGQTLFWHRELPPLDADVLSEGTLEATSERVMGTLANRDALWDRCLEQLMVQARTRLGQEISRLGGHYAHVLSESIDTRRDDRTGETWLHGTFAYVLLVRPAAVPQTA
jgi:hypothetical protein